MGSGNSAEDPFELEAKYYDKIWGLADTYESETKFLDKILKEYGAHRILDLACGTGGHCLQLAKSGYDVVGLDVSRTMLEKAREKLSKAGLQAVFFLGEMTKVQSSLLNAKTPLPFDAVVCMGNALAEHTPL